jgi:hypothetical protein
MFSGTFQCPIIYQVSKILWIEKYKIVQNILKDSLFSFTKFCYLKKKKILKKISTILQIVKFSVVDAQSTILV